MSREWRCFHCDELFTDADAAREHFGGSQIRTPACQIDAAHVRELELQLDAYRQEDTELHRCMYGMESRHRTELLREEEKGYASGLADGMKEGAELLRQARDTLEMARAGLDWYRDEQPDSVNGCDEEADEKIDATIAAINERLQLGADTTGEPTCVERITS